VETSALDIVYVVRPGDDNNELRHSLRSLANLPHARVWLVGHLPAWAHNVEAIQTTQIGRKYANSTRNLLTACQDDRLTEQVVLFNDDFFCMTPASGVDVWNRGPVSEVNKAYRSGPYGTGMRDTANLLHRLGHPDPISYELHLPMVIDRALMADTIKTGMRARIPVLHKRTLYGNLHGPAGTTVTDVKVHTEDPDGWRDWPWLSTSDTSFSLYPVGQHIRDRFPEPSRYERGNS
jgi:hypothetical protein